MVSFFEDLCDCAAEAKALVKICFSSRHYPTVFIMKGVELILEDAAGHNKDIKQFINSKLRVADSKQAELLRCEILEKSSGIFLWVVLVIDIINGQYRNERASVAKMHEHLKKLPPRLNDLFEMILSRDGDNLEQLELCLKWILFANRPLKPQELYFAIQFGCDRECSGLGDQEDTSLGRMKAFVRSSSKGLAETTQNKASEVQFIHESVRGFLLGKYEGQWSGSSGNFTGHSHETLKRCCLSQLKSPISQHFNIPDPLPKASNGAKLREAICSKFPFLGYCVLNVFQHANSAQANGIPQKQFLTDFPLQWWILLNNALECSDIRRYRESSSPTLLYIMAEKNLANLIQTDSRRMAGFQIEDTRYGAPILAALATSSHAAIWALVEAQAENKPLMCPLPSHYEEYRWKSKITQSLRRDLVFSRRKGILSYLRDVGDEAIIFAFLLASPKLDLGHSFEKSLLFWAVKQGHPSVAWLLLEKNTHLVHLMNLKDSDGQNLLFSAVQRDLYDIVRLLPDGGSGVNFESLDHTGCTPLLHAVKKKDGVMVGILLQKGADANSRGNFYNTPLVQATEGGDEQSVRLLLEAGADIEAKDAFGRTPLCLAVGEELESVVRLLLRKGANVEVKSEFGHTPLLRAAKGGSDTCTRLLLEAGADIEAKDDFGRTSLSRAATNGHEAVVRVLLENGADTQAQDYSVRTALLMAAEKGHTKVVGLLLKNGAEIHAKDVTGRTPLSVATASGHEEVIRQLRSWSEQHVASLHEDTSLPHE